MKSTFRYLSLTACAFALTFTLGCAPPEPAAEPDVSTDMMDKKDSNMTASSDMPMMDKEMDEEPMDKEAMMDKEEMMDK